MAHQCRVNSASKSLIRRGIYKPLFVRHGKMVSTDDLVYLSIDMNVFMMALQDVLEAEALSTAVHSADERPRGGVHCCYVRD